MFWLARPPYLRWAAAACIVVGAAAWDLAGRRTEPFPFAAADIAPGQAISDDLLEWRHVPLGLLVRPDLEAPVAKADIAAGDPVTAAMVSGDAMVPAGWWAVPIALPGGAVPGTAVRLVVAEPQLTVDGVVVASGERDLLSPADAGLVAVPGEVAPAVARAAAEGAVTVLVEP